MHVVPLRSPSMVATDSPQSILRVHPTADACVTLQDGLMSIEVISWYPAFSASLSIPERMSS